jgi:hypothetical protein
MQQHSRTRNNNLTVLLLLAIYFFIVSYKDLKKGFVEGFNSYNTTKSTHSKQQSILIENDSYSIQLMIFNKIY